MGDRVKSALFNTIQTELADSRVLDAYGGSGALAIESLSRGASFVQVVEKDKKAFTVIKQNFENLKIEPELYKITQANCASWASGNTDKQFDIILLDPPYDHLNLSTVDRLVSLLTPNGLMVLSHTGREAVPTVNKVVVVDNRIYAGAALSYYRKVA